MSIDIISFVLKI